jgi:hypothetical protein
MPRGPLQHCGLSPCLACMRLHAVPCSQLQRMHVQQRAGAPCGCGLRPRCQGGAKRQAACPAGGPATLHRVPHTLGVSAVRSDGHGVWHLAAPALCRLPHNCCHARHSHQCSTCSHSLSAARPSTGCLRSKRDFWGPIVAGTATGSTWGRHLQ